MERPSFLTLFPRLKSRYLRKDVGSLPYYLASCCGWNSAIAYLEEGNVGGKPICDEAYEQHVRILQMGERKGQYSDAFTVLKFIFKEARHFDLLNMYHDSLMHMIFALTYKLCNPHGVVYLKLDIGYLGFKTFQELSEGMFSRYIFWFKRCLSRFTVDIYSVETVAIYNGLVDSSYFDGRLFCLPNGTIFDDSKELSELWKVKEKIILTVGNLGAYEKNNELLLDALASISAEVLEGWKVLFVGPIVKSDYYESGVKDGDQFMSHVLAVVEQYPHLAKVLEFTGPIIDRERLKELYDRASIFCLTSRKEGFPHVLLEAANSACYIISTDFPAAREITDDGRYGSLFESEDRKTLSEILCQCITNMIPIEDSSSKIFKKCRNTYDWRSIAARLDVKLRSIMKVDSCV